jgi:phage tail-like protein
MSMDIGGSANASVSADGNASAGASIGGGIGGTLAGALGGSLSAGLGVAGGLAVSAAANLAANVNLSAGLSARFGGPAAVVGTNPPDIYPLYKFMVQFQGLGPMRFQSCGPIKATQGIAPSATPPPAVTHNNAPAAQGSPAAHGTTAANSSPAAHGTTSTATQNISQGGGGGASTRLPSGVWTWTDLTLTRGMAKDGLPLLQWIMGWLKGDRKTRLDLTVILLDLEGIPVMTWHFKKTFPTEWSLPSFSAGPAPGALVIETLKLAYDGSPDLILG